MEYAEEERKEHLFDLIKNLNFEDMLNKEPELLNEKFKDGSLLDRDGRCSRMFNQVCRNKAFEYSVLKKKQEGCLGKDLPVQLTPGSPLPKVLPPVSPPATPALTTTAPTPHLLPPSPPASAPPASTPAPTPLANKHKLTRCSINLVKIEYVKTEEADDSEGSGSTERCGKDSDSDSEDSTGVELLAVKRPRRGDSLRTLSFQHHLQRFPANDMKLLNIRKSGATASIEVYDFQVNTNYKKDQ